MFKKVGIIFMLACVLAAAASAASWHVVKSGSASGGFAIKSVTATVNRPGSLGVRLVGHVMSGSGVVSCTKGTSVSAWSRSYTHTGTFRLPMIRAADSCMVVAAVGGSGRVTVQILAYR